MTKEDEMKRFLDMCLALTAERDREALLSSILDNAMDIAHADAGTLYLLEDDGLHFCRMVTRSMGVRQGGHASPISLPPVPLEEKYVCSWVALHNELINVSDVHTDTHFDFTGSLRYDAMTGYCTQSMLVVPMSNDRGEVIGVAQLINATDAEGNTIGFDPEVELLISAISSQAAISITNMKYSEQITSLLDSLVGALSTAIDERTPYNANHTRNMVATAHVFSTGLRRPGTNGISTPTGGGRSC
jgi:GAF domain-containing protein